MTRTLAFCSSVMLNLFQHLPAICSLKAHEILKQVQDDGVVEAVV